LGKNGKVAGSVIIAARLSPSAIWRAPIAAVDARRACALKYGSHAAGRGCSIVILLEALAVYALIGAALALAFLTRGIARVLGPCESVSLPARCLLFPGTLVFWPLILTRWLKAVR
jgi:hypothetical protein